MNFSIKSSDEKRLAEAQRVAREYADQQKDEDVIGIAFLGAITRGYFDAESDIDITIFKTSFKQGIVSDTREHRGFHLHEFVVDYERERALVWDSGKRWAYSKCQIFWEREEKVTSLLQEKVPLKREERDWLVMSGIALSEWYCTRLTESWIERGDLPSAHYMISEGINHFFNVMFALDNEITPDYKWRLFSSKQLKTAPANYEEKMTEVLKVQDISVDDLRRRIEAFSDLWNQYLPRVEDFLGKKYQEFKDKI